jgi:predicted nucleic acid-binding protein
VNQRVFLDTAYAIALASQNDKHHRQAIALAEIMEQEFISLVTTRAVQLEIGNSLSKQRYRQAGIQLLKSLDSDPTVSIVEVSEKLYCPAINDKDIALH